MKLIDVARASLSELSNDYLNWILHHESTPWSTKSPDYHAVNSIQLDRPTYKEDVLHMSGIHILAQKHKFDQWLNNEDSLITANCLIILCNRLIMMLHRQIEHLLKTFKAEGGFTESLTAERLAYRQQESIQSDAPKCPLCGKPMIKRMAKKGINSGKEFWSCSGYPNCNGTLNIK